jgi:hypothetical protein
MSFSTAEAAHAHLMVWHVGGFWVAAVAAVVVLLVLAFWRNRP